MKGSKSLGLIYLHLKDKTFLLIDSTYRQSCPDNPKRISRLTSFGCKRIGRRSRRITRVSGSSSLNTRSPRQSDHFLGKNGLVLSIGLSLTEMTKKSGELWREMKDKSEWEKKVTRIFTKYTRFFANITRSGRKMYLSIICKDHTFYK